jgi:NAD(P)-dependent dehydrogenase (short-subunit alcohol dehydrogenase family)
MAKAELQGRAVLVTGGASGIGRATAVAFARAGAPVAVSDVSEAGGAETVDEIRENGGEGMFVRSDVTNSTSVQALVAAVVSASSGPT